MGWRVRRSVRVMPGVRLNLGRRGSSLSIGKPGAKLNIGPRGTRTTLGIPGTGVSYVSTRPRARARSNATGQPASRNLRWSRLAWLATAILVVTVIARSL